MDYIKVSEAAEKWGISPRRVRLLCAEGKINGVIQKGKLYLLGKIEDSDPDIIIIGSQSQSDPFTDSSLKYLPVMQHEFLLSCVPDCYILCINLSDEINYIKRTIAYLESIFNSKVLALAALPLEHAQKWSVLSNKKVSLSSTQIEEKR